MKGRILYSVTLISGICTSGCAKPVGQPPSPATQVRINRTPPSRVASNVTLKPKADGPVVIRGLRKFPFPYKAMLAIASDADHQTIRKFNLIHRFLNTKTMTSMGRGLGLDIADSFFVYNGSNLPMLVDINNTPMDGLFTYFRGTTQLENAGHLIDSYIKSGWIDSIHTYGDFSRVNTRETAFRRSLAVQGIRALQAHGDFVQVWIDHGNQSNVDNFGSYGIKKFFNYQEGANPRSPYYHTDLLIPYGIQFVWADQTSDVFGKDSMVYPVKLPDGRKVWGFTRHTNVGYSKNGVPKWVWSIDSLNRQLTPHNLRSIERTEQYAIVAQHLCADNKISPLPKSAISSLRLLAGEQDNGRILVSRTSRLLRYNVSQKYTLYAVLREKGKAVINITTIADPVFGSHAPSLSDLRGITFYTSDPGNTEIRVNNVPVRSNLIQINASDGKSPSITIRWYPPNTNDYSQTPTTPVRPV